VKVSESRIRSFRDVSFCLREKEAPRLLRASGDSGFVSHLVRSTRGATGWDWSFRMLKNQRDAVTVTDGRVTLFVDEPGQFVPANARTNELVALRLPRARENLFPHRFTVFGGQGGATANASFVKLFVAVSVDAVAPLIEHFTGRAADSLRFTLSVCNSPADYDRADSAIFDIAEKEESAVLKTLEAFMSTRPTAVVSRGVPLSTIVGRLGLPRAVAQGRADLCDGYGLRICESAMP
jgi:hypothetical protein